MHLFETGILEMIECFCTLFLVSSWLSFLLNGADVIITASYQASVEGLCQHLNVSPEKALDLISDSVALAKAASDWFITQPQVK